VPAPAVIPAPIVYFKVVAVKTLVVYLRVGNIYSSTFHGSFLAIIYLGGKNHHPFWIFGMMISVLNISISPLLR